MRNNRKQKQREDKQKQNRKNTADKEKKTRKKYKKTEQKKSDKHTGHTRHYCVGYLNNLCFLLSIGAHQYLIAWTVAGSENDLQQS